MSAAVALSACTATVSGQVGAVPGNSQHSSLQGTAGHRGTSPAERPGAGGRPNEVAWEMPPDIPGWKRSDYQGDLTLYKLDALPCAVVVERDDTPQPSESTDRDLLRRAAGALMDADLRLARLSEIRALPPRGFALASDPSATVDFSAQLLIGDGLSAFSYVKQIGTVALLVSVMCTSGVIGAAANPLSGYALLVEPGLRRLRVKYRP